MAWTPDDIRQQIEHEPRLGLALTQYFVRRSLEFQDRIENMAVHYTPERIMLALMQLASQFGTAMPDGARRVSSFTHHTLAAYVGTSREIVTSQMNRLRQLGLIRYCRRYIDVYHEAIEEELRGRGITSEGRSKAASRG